MATGEKPARHPVIRLAPTAGGGEHWWPVALAIIVVAGLHIALPVRYRVHPAWVVPAVLLVAVAVLIAGDPGRIDRQVTWLRIMIGALIAFITLANLSAAIRLVVDILSRTRLYADNAAGLLAAGGVIWVTNVIAFGLWYWAFDRGGPVARLDPRGRLPDFLFPQMSEPDHSPAGWRPELLDYLYVSLTNSIAFSPTDTLPLTHRAKLLMALQSSASAITILLVAARAVNILN
jgi:hypothetical protein